MKKLIAIVITFMLIFDGTGYCLRPPLICARLEESILKKLGIKDLNSDRIGGLQIKTWLKEHRLFSHLPPQKITSYLNHDAYEDWVRSSRDHRKLHEVEQYILDYGLELYIAEINPGYQQLVHWMHSLKDTYDRNKAGAEERGKEFKARFVDYLNGRAGPHVHTIRRGNNNISPFEWAAQGRFFWQIHENRHGLLFGKIEISGKTIGDLPIIPVDKKGRLDESLIQWMFQRASIPPLKYYQAKKVSLKELLGPKKEHNIKSLHLQLDFDFGETATGL